MTYSKSKRDDPMQDETIIVISLERMTWFIPDFKDMIYSKEIWSIPKGDDLFQELLERGGT
jgi:hypothetical protein